MGDLLFSIANLSRKLGIEPETALRKANDKFTRRFEQMERSVAASGRAMKDLSLDELEQEWQQAKSRQELSSSAFGHEDTKHTTARSLQSGYQRLGHEQITKRMGHDRHEDTKTSTKRKIRSRSQHDPSAARLEATQR